METWACSVLFERLRGIVVPLGLVVACLLGLLLGAIGADSPALTPRTAFGSLGSKLSGYHCAPQTCPWRLGTGQLPKLLGREVVML